MNIAVYFRNIIKTTSLMLILIIDKIFFVYMLMLLARVFGSWFPELQRTRFMQFIAFYTDPYLNFYRRFIPPLGMMDFSPIVAFLCLGVIEQIVKSLAIMLIR